MPPKGWKRNRFGRFTPPDMTLRPRGKQPSAGSGTVVRRRAFARAIATGATLAEASAAVGYATGTATRLSQEPDVRAMVEQEHAKALQRSDMKVDEWRGRLVSLARADVRALMDPATGTVRALAELDEATADLIAGFDVQRTRTRVMDHGEEKVTIEDQIIRVRLVDRLRALEMLGRHLGLFRDVPAVNIGITMTVADLPKLDDHEVAVLTAIALKMRPAAAPTP